MNVVAIGIAVEFVAGTEAAAAAGTEVIAGTRAAVRKLTGQKDLHHRRHYQLQH